MCVRCNQRRERGCICLVAYIEHGIACPPVLPDPDGDNHQLLQRSPNFLLLLQLHLPAALLQADHGCPDLVQPHQVLAPPLFLESLHHNTKLFYLEICQLPWPKAHAYTKRIIRPLKKAEMPWFCALDSAVSFMIDGLIILKWLAKGWSSLKEQQFPAQVITTCTPQASSAFFALKWSFQLCDDPRICFWFPNLVFLLCSIGAESPNIFTSRTCPCNIVQLMEIA